MLLVKELMYLLSDCEFIFYYKLEKKGNKPYRVFLALGIYASLQEFLRRDLEGEVPADWVVTEHALTV